MMPIRSLWVPPGPRSFPAWLLLSVNSTILICWHLPRLRQVRPLLQLLFYPRIRQRLSTLRTEKRRINRDVEHDDKRSLKTFSITSSTSGAGHRTSSVHNAKKQSPAAPPKPNRSNLLDKLSKLRSGPEKTVEAELVERSFSFGAKARYPVLTIHHDVALKSSATHTFSAIPSASNIVNAPARDSRLALVEDLQPGPYDHKPPFDDPLFETFEPHSGIHLSCAIDCNGKTLKAHCLF